MTVSSKKVNTVPKSETLLPTSHSDLIGKFYTGKTLEVPKTELRAQKIVVHYRFER